MLIVEKVIIEVNGLVKYYGEVKALDGVSFDIRKGEIFGLLGPNGAGKITLIEILCGLRRFDEGKVTILGLNLAESSYKIRSLIGLCPQETPLYDLLNMHENLVLLLHFIHCHLKSLKKD